MLCILISQNRTTERRQPGKPIPCSPWNRHLRPRCNNPKPKSPLPPPPLPTVGAALAAASSGPFGLGFSWFLDLRAIRKPPGSGILENCTRTLLVYIRPHSGIWSRAPGCHLYPPRLAPFPKAVCDNSHRMLGATILVAALVFGGWDRPRELKPTTGGAGCHATPHECTRATAVPQRTEAPSAMEKPRSLV